MRIGIDIRPLLEHEPSGVGEYTEKLVGTLLTQDTRNEYLLFSNAYHAPPDRFERFDRPNVTMRCFAYPNRLLNAAFSLFAWPSLDRLLGGLDLFFAPNLTFLSLSRACRLVVTVHDLSFVHYPSFYPLKGRLWHAAIRVSRLLARADQIIAVSEHTRNDIIEHFGIPADKLATISSGIDIETYRKVSEAVKETVREKYALPEQFILGVSAWDERKNIESVLSAFERLQESTRLPHHLVLLGTERKRTKRLRKSMERSPTRKNIHCVDAVAREDKPVLLALAACLVYPSFYEGFGFPPLEAMAAGTPVIAAAAASLPAVTDGAALLVDPYNVNELTCALRHVLTTPSLAKRLRVRGRAQVKHFSWGAAAAKTLELFATLTHAHRH